MARARKQSKRIRRSVGRALALGTALVGCALVFFCQRTSLGGQPASAAAAELPDPIYWKQDLFLVPYQWSSAAETAAAQAVWLYVSKDRGASWQKISEARPHVKAFTYRAEGDGEYWFAVRTIDHQGRQWPEGRYQPELRVIVDTTMPRIDELRAALLADGSVEIAWRAWDQNFDAGTWQVEAQIDEAGAWQPVAVRADSPSDGVFVGRTVWQPPAGVRPHAIRATVRDRAGNSAAYQTTVQTSPVSSTAPPDQTGDQTWSAAVVSRTPFRLSGTAASPMDDGVTVYGDPGTQNVIASTPLGDDTAYNADAPTFKPLEPFRQASIRRLPPPDPETVVRGSPDPAPAATSGQPFGEDGRPAPNNAPVPNVVPTGDVKWVGSRTFALEYDLDDTGRWGVSHIELWGTRDGGHTWRRYAREQAQSGPLIATVDEEGLYGFRIVTATTLAAPQPPRAGDEPELWVAVDLSRPVVELTAIERGEGNLADHLFLRWRAVDDNLQPRPIALFYSSRSSGPWSAIAVHLENTGQYAWRVDRHVPERFYLRIEARDLAGNLAAFQTREPIEFDPPQPTVQLRGVETVGPTASGGPARPLDVR